MNEYERWQDRFSGQDYAFGKEPNYFLKSCKQLLPRSGRALAVADGEGRNGVWLAEQGLDVLSIDFSPLAQAKARALAIEMGVSVNFETRDSRGDVTSRNVCSDRIDGAQTKASRGLADTTTTHVQCNPFGRRPRSIFAQ